MMNIFSSFIEMLPLSIFRVTGTRLLVLTTADNGRKDGRTNDQKT